MIRVKRVYDPWEVADGARFLVERLWPRGVRKEELRLDVWLKEVAPSGDLRRWFGHAPGKWEEFKRLYSAELDSNPKVWKPLLEAASAGTVTLLCSARDREYNNAVVLKAYLDARQGPDTKSGNWLGWASVAFVALAGWVLRRLAQTPAGSPMAFGVSSTLAQGRDYHLHEKGGRQRWQ